VAEAFERHAGVDLLASVAADGATDRDALAAAARAAGIRVAEDDSWADVFSRILVEKVEPHLGEGRATILCEYPISEAALARRRPATRAWPNASSSMPAGSSWPTPSAN
jgi:lysyl-tRNA synthetase class 2